MSFQDYQLSESRSDEMTIGASYKLTGLSLPLKFAGKKITLSNELQFNFDFTYRNNITTLYRLDQNIYEPTSDEIVSALIPKHLNFQMWRVLLDSNAAEHGARMSAM